MHVICNSAAYITHDAVQPLSVITGGHLSDYRYMQIPALKCGKLVA